MISSSGLPWTPLANDYFAVIRHAAIIFSLVNVLKPNQTLCVTLIMQLWGAVTTREPNFNSVVQHSVELMFNKC